MKWSAIVVILCCIVVVGAFFVAKKGGAARFGGGNYDNFAQCLTAEGVTMFGAYWCPQTDPIEKPVDAVQATIYVGGAAYVGFYGGRSKCMNPSLFYMLAYGPVATECVAGAASAGAGAPKDGLLVCRLMNNTIEDKVAPSADIVDAAVGGAIGFAEGSTIAAFGYGAGFFVGFLVDLFT